MVYILNVSQRTPEGWSWAEDPMGVGVQWKLGYWRPSLKDIGVLPLLSTSWLPHCQCTGHKLGTNSRELWLLKAWANLKPLLYSVWELSPGGHSRLAFSSFVVVYLKHTRWTSLKGEMGVFTWNLTMGRMSHRRADPLRADPAIWSLWSMVTVTPGQKYWRLNRQGDFTVI